MLHEELWRANADLAAACLEHPFVRGLADGRLDAEAFKRYVAQDAFFLRAFLRAYGVAAAKADQLDHVEQFIRMMQGGLEELKLHARYAERLGIDLAGVKPLATTLAYTDFLQRTAWHGSVAEIVAALTPCMRLYAWLGSELGKGGVPTHAYADWIATYSGGEFQTLADEFESLLDVVAADTPAVRDAYRYAMQCELDFFSSPL